MKVILITCGDEDGIGFEIVSRAVGALKIPKNIKLVIFRPLRPKKDWSKLYARKSLSVSTYDEMFSSLNANTPQVIDFKCVDNPVEWVENSVKICRDHKNFSLINGPMSKTLIAKTGRKDLGHTDIIKRVCGISNVQMAFIGKYFSTILATDHIDLSKVEESLASLSSSLVNVALFKDLFSRNIRTAILGLNPHAGESGLIGGFEKKFYSLPIRKFMKKNHLYGPFPADSFFAKNLWKQYPLVFAMYHDQGLIPFKMQHQNLPTVHMALGIPFVRTTVDHGTAKDIANKGVADFSSMLEAIKLNIQLVNRGN